MDAELCIELLGGFAVAVDGMRVAERAWRLRKARSLVKLLALAPRHTLHREQICELLWPDRDLPSASQNLRQTLHVARAGDRHRSTPGRLASDGDLITLSGPGLHIDLVELRTRRRARARAPTVAALRDAAARYGGELLPEDRFEPGRPPPRRRARAVPARRRRARPPPGSRRRRGRRDRDAAARRRRRSRCTSRRSATSCACTPRPAAVSAALAQYQALRETLRLRARRRAGGRRRASCTGRSSRATGQPTPGRPSTRPSCRCAAARSCAAVARRRKPARRARRASSVASSRSRTSRGCSGAPGCRR